jgi:hypothetical protein
MSEIIVKYIPEEDVTLIGRPVSYSPTSLMYDDEIFKFCGGCDHIGPLLFCQLNHLLDIQLSSSATASVVTLQ